MGHAPDTVVTVSAARILSLLKTVPVAVLTVVHVLLAGMESAQELKHAQTAVQTVGLAKAPVGTLSVSWMKHV